MKLASLIKEQMDIGDVLYKNRDQIELDFGPRTFKTLQSSLMMDDEAYVRSWLIKNGYMDEEKLPFEEIYEAYSGFIRNPEDPASEPFEPTGSVAQFREELRALFGKFKGDLKNPEFIKGVAQIMINWKSLLRSQLNEAMGSFSTIQEISELVKDGLSREQAYDRVRLRKEIELRQQLGLPTIQQNYSGGVVGQSVQDFNDVVKTINA